MPNGIPGTRSDVSSPLDALINDTWEQVSGVLTNTGQKVDDLYSTASDGLAIDVPAPKALAIYTIWFINLADGIRQYADMVENHGAQWVDARFLTADGSHGAGDYFREKCEESARFHAVAPNAQIIEFI